MARRYLRVTGVPEGVATNPRRQRHRPAIHARRLKKRRLLQCGHLIRLTTFILLAFRDYTEIILRTCACVRSHVRRYHPSRTITMLRYYYYYYYCKFIFVIIVRVAKSVCEVHRRWPFVVLFRVRVLCTRSCFPSEIILLLIIIIGQRLTTVSQGGYE